MKKLIVGLFFIFVTSLLHAQYNSVIQSGEIHYEFKVNQYERAKKIIGNQITESPYRDYIQSFSVNKFATRQFILSFNNQVTSFREMDVKASPNNLDFVTDFPTRYVYRNLTSDTVYIEKTVIGETMKIKDKSAPILWKFTNERMNILGCECRRANGLLFDSVYVVAFYCPDIPIAAGPSIFGGLPGMILGVSLPHDNINIFAQKMDIKEVQTTLYPQSQKSLKKIEEYISFLRQTFSTNVKAIQHLGFNLRTALL